MHFECSRPVLCPSKYSRVPKAQVKENAQSPKTCSPKRHPSEREMPRDAPTQEAHFAKILNPFSKPSEMLPGRTPKFDPLTPSPYVEKLPRLSLLGDSHQAPKRHGFGRGFKPG